MSRKLSLLLIIAILALATPAFADVSPYEEVLVINYGKNAGEVDPMKVDGDDPYRTLIQSFRVEPNGTVWILPTVGVAGRTVIYCYELGAFSHEVPFTGYPCGFLLTEEGVYSWGPGGNRSVAANIAFDPGPGRGEVRRAKLLANTMSPAGFSGWMKEVNGTPCLLGRGARNHLFTLPLNAGLSDTELMNAATKGVSVSGSETVWQDTKLIRRGEQVVFDLDLEEGGLLEVLTDGGFVIRRPGEMDGGKFNPVFEIRDLNGDLIRRVVTYPGTDYFGVDMMPWFFTRDHVYQLLLGEDEGRLLRY